MKNPVQPMPLVVPMCTAFKALSITENLKRANQILQYLIEHSRSLNKLSLSLNINMAQINVPAYKKEVKSFLKSRKSPSMIFSSNIRYQENHYF